MILWLTRNYFVHLVTFSSRNLSIPKSNGGIVLEQTTGNEMEISTFSSCYENVVKINEIPMNLNLWQNTDILFGERLLPGFMKESLR